MVKRNILLSFLKNVKVSNNFVFIFLKYIFFGKKNYIDIIMYYYRK